MAGTRDRKAAIALGQAIMTRRQRKGMTQLDLAERLGIEQHSVSRMEKGIISPKISRLQDIAELLDCTVADLFRQTETSARVRAQDICRLLEELSPEMQEVVVELVENTVSGLKKLEKRGGRAEDRQTPPLF